MPVGQLVATDALREKRILVGLRQQDLADRARVDRSHLSFVERGKTAVTTTVAARLCGVLNLTVAQAVEQGLFQFAKRKKGKRDGSKRQ
jgi:transcriptional regulator with XRE-family HTH domain